MDELVDILDSDGNPTGKSVLKSEAHQKGLLHPTVHVWCYTKSGELLFQKRAAAKKTFPSMWDVSVAGHVAAEENIENAAIREVEEEIGLHIQAKDLIKVGVFKSEHQHPNGIIDAEFNHCFLAELKVPLASLQPQEEEVEDLQLISIPTLKQLWKEDRLEGFVPISKAYWHALFDKLNELL